MDILSFVLGYKKGKSQGGGGIAENKLAKFVDGSLTEITAEDLDGATKIRDYMFAQTQIPSVDIPDSVESIGDYAFSYCEALTGLTISDGVKSLGQYSFQFCKNLVNLTMGNNVQIVDNNAFLQCGKIKSVILPAVTKIKNYAFYGCDSLETVSIGNRLTYMHRDVFGYCSGLTNFIIESPILNTFNLKDSRKLTIDSLKNIINALVDYSGTENEGTYTLTLNSPCKTTLDNEGATAPDGLTWSEYIQAKGWLLA